MYLVKYSEIGYSSRSLNNGTYRVAYNIMVSVSSAINVLFLSLRSL